MALPSGNYISLFAGAAGFDLGLRIACQETRCVCLVENEVNAAQILAARCREGSLDDCPIWSDVRTFPCDTFRGRVAGIIGGFPCTDLSVAGKQAGIVDGKHSSLWFEYLRIIREVQPEWIVIENVPAVIAFPAGGIVLSGLAEAGFDAEWLSIRASDIGASHGRLRVFILAYRKGRGFGKLRESPRRNRLIGGGSEGVAIPEHAGSPCAGAAAKPSATADDIGRSGERMVDQADQWLTPHGMSGMDKTGKLGGGGEFAKQATEWMTPNCPNGGRSVSEEVVLAKGSTGGGKVQVGLESQVKFWPTPKTVTGGAESAERKQEFRPH